VGLRTCRLKPRRSAPRCQEQRRGRSDPSGEPVRRQCRAPRTRSGRPRPVSRRPPRATISAEILSAHSAAPELRAARIWLASGPDRSPCAGGRPRPRRVARATWRALRHQPRCSLARGGAVRGRGASRCGDEPQMLQILTGASPAKLIVRRKHRAQCVEHVLTCLLACAALAEGSWDLQHTRHYPATLVRLIKRNREVDGGRHEPQGSATDAPVAPMTEPERRSHVLEPPPWQHRGNTQIGRWVRCVRRTQQNGRSGR